MIFNKFIVPKSSHSAKLRDVIRGRQLIKLKNPSISTVRIS